MATEMLLLLVLLVLASAAVTVALVREVRRDGYGHRRPPARPRWSDGARLP